MELGRMESKPAVGGVYGAMILSTPAFCGGGIVVVDEARRVGLVSESVLVLWPLETETGFECRYRFDLTLLPPDQVWSVRVREQNIGDVS
jgi:hypothetical protein